jgi:hypothetical protein
MGRITARWRRMRERAEEDRGMALMLVLMVLMLLSALMVGFMTSIIADSRSGGVDRDGTQAYAAAHAGMEKLTSDLAALFSSDYSPSGTQISNTAANPPTISGFTYTDPDGSSGYKVQYTAVVGGVNTLVQTPSTAVPVPNNPTTGTTIAAGPYQGFKGIVTHYNIIVTARSTGGAEVRMRRELQTVAVPVFQFGVFSEPPLSFHAGANFNFGGRIHTNGNLYLTAGNNVTLTLGDKVTAVGEIVRKYLDNGYSATGSWGGTVSMASGTNVFRNLAASEGSVINDVGSAVNEPTWTQLSVGTYNGYIRNGRTGARRLDLPLVSNGALAVDLIRRPPQPVAGVGENSSKPLVYAQRYYAQASLRILLSDLSADITSLPQVTATAPISLEGASLFGPTGKKAPLPTSAGTGNYKTPAGTPLVGGVIKIEMQQNDSTWVDVTQEILDLGIAGKNLSTGVVNAAFNPASGGNARNSTLNTCLATEPQPDAVLRLERVADVPSTHSAGASQYDCAVTAAGVPSAVSTDYWPLALHDAREGVKRDESGATATTSISIGGVMYYVELDTNNLARWFRGIIGTSGTLAKNDNNGYIVYFSDRRNNRNLANAETGEFGNEDIINPASSAGTANGTLDAGEDVNATTRTGYVPVLDTYGTLPSYNGVANSVVPGSTAPLGSTARVNDVLTAADSTAVSTNASVLRGNRPIFFRRALKLTGGSSLRTSAITGLTIASENPVYVQGSYNASAPIVTTETHVAAAIICDAIILLSNAWNDINSFYPYPQNPQGTMAASDSGYRFAVVAGKSISFPRPTGWTPEIDFGNDGGAHNLMRLLENWSGRTTFYRGSLVSFYIARQATGIYKSGTYTYGAGTRAYAFDTDFLLPDRLPPGTPMFRDVNTLTFRQVLRPNQ